MKKTNIRYIGSQEALLVISTMKQTFHAISTKVMLSEKQMNLKHEISKLEVGTCIVGI
jgi:hypothetical protein